MNGNAMHHLTEEQLLDAYYGEIEAAAHLGSCVKCRADFDRLREMLDTVREYPAPARNSNYGAAVWTRLLPNLPADPPRKVWRPWWAWAPALAALLVLAFLSGRLTEPGAHRNGISEKARQRVLLISLSDHLERAQLVLANVENAVPGSADLLSERDRAHELLGANRLLREAALRLDDFADAALLDDLERGLLPIANAPIHSSPEDLEAVRQWIEKDSLLFKVRVAAGSSRERGQSL